MLVDIPLLFIRCLLFASFIPRISVCSFVAFTSLSLFYLLLHLRYHAVALLAVYMLYALVCGYYQQLMALYCASDTAIAAFEEVYKEVLER